MNDEDREALARLIRHETGEPAEESGFLADAILAAGFRRTVQAEPQGESTDDEREVLAEVERVQKAAWAEIHGQDPMRKYSVGEVKRLVYSFDNLLGSLLTRRPVQDEPTDAQVEAAWRAYEKIPPETFVMGPWIGKARDRMRAALRAAFQEGENRG